MQLQCGANHRRWVHSSPTSCLKNELYALSGHGNAKTSGTNSHGLVWEVIWGLVQEMAWQLVQRMFQEMVWEMVWDMLWG